MPHNQRSDSRPHPALALPINLDVYGASHDGPLLSGFTCDLAHSLDKLHCAQNQLQFTSAQTDWRRLSRHAPIEGADAFKYLVAEHNFHWRPFL